MNVKFLLKPWLWAVVLQLMMQACNHKENAKTKVRVLSPSQPKATIRISSYNNLGDSTLVEAKTDSVGFSEFESVLSRATFFNIQIGQKYGEVYLSPGDQLMIKANSVDYKVPLTFSGSGSEVNNYVSWVNSTVESIKWANELGIDLEKGEFLQLLDSMKATVNGFHDHYVDSVSLPDNIIEMLRIKNEVKISEVVQEYKFYNLNRRVNEKYQAHDLGQTTLSETILKGIEDLPEDVRFDTTLLSNGYMDYHVLLNFYWHNNINLPVSEELIGSKDSKELVAVMTNALIKKGQYPDKIREYLIAFDLSYWLGTFGINPGIDSVLADFKRAYPHSTYLKALKRDYNGWLALAPGKPVPEFLAYTLDGDSVCTRDLRGKILYVDVWATWCGPCIAEIPASKKLQAKFAGNEHIQFVNISVDQNKSDWKKFIQSEKTWPGLHLIIGRDRAQSFYKDYKISGVPNYVMIDDEGKIISIKAPRPSDENTEAEIRSVLSRYGKVPNSF